MSKAELHTLRHRMHAGREAKAACGELACALPRGYVRDPSVRVVFDPGASVQARVRGVFRTFARYGSLSATLRALAADGQGLPVRRAQGPQRGELAWPIHQRVSPQAATPVDASAAPKVPVRPLRLEATAAHDQHPVATRVHPPPVAEPAVCRQSPEVGAGWSSDHVRICAAGAGQPASLPRLKGRRATGASTRLELPALVDT